MRIHITKHSGKMTGIDSISTSTTHNKFCQKLATVEGTVCGKCYASRFEKQRPTLVTALNGNGIALSSSVLPIDKLPYINADIFRFSSFGELINTNHAVNLLNITYKNPHVLFALWTKRSNLVHAAIRKVGLPTNINLIYSAPFLNQKPALPKHFTKTFTVYSKGVEVETNCAAISCLSCRLCYSRNDTVDVAERVH